MDQGNKHSGLLGVSRAEAIRAISRFGTTIYRCSEIPRLVSPDLRFKALAGTVDGGCAVTIDGALYCWGENLHGEQSGVLRAADGHRGDRNAAGHLDD